MDKPIIEIDEYRTKIYKLNGKLHREDGPACEWVNGIKQWAINGEYVTRATQEQTFHHETTKLGSITQFIDFVARCDIIFVIINKHTTMDCRYCGFPVNPYERSIKGMHAECHWMIEQTLSHLKIKKGS